MKLKKDDIGNFIALLVIIFVLFLVAYTIVAYIAGAFAFGYEFVYCHHGPTNSTITYPEGTECEGLADEKGHADESEE